MMTNSVNSNPEQAVRIRTNIKFYKGLNGIEDKLYGFVHKKNGSWRGCRVDETIKKLVLVDPSLNGTIEPNMLYHCSLVPMQCNNGFIAVSATPVKFDHEISYGWKEMKYAVAITWGNQHMIYIPQRNEPSDTIAKMAENLKKKWYLKNPLQAATDFTNAAILERKRFEERPRRKKA